MKYPAALTEKAAKTWKTFLKIPSTSGRYLTDSSLILSRTQPNLYTNSYETCIQTHFKNSENSHYIPFGPPIPLKKALGYSYSPSGQKLCVFYNCEKSSGCFVEVFGNGQKFLSVSLEEVHGNVYPNPPLGGISWSEKEDKVAYIAERKAPKNKEYIELVKEYKKAESAPKDITYGMKNLWSEDWGENLVGVKNPQIYVLDLPSESSGKVIGLPEHLSAGTPLFSTDKHIDDTIVFVGYESTPNRHGLYAYNTRPSKLYSVKAVIEGEKDGESAAVIKCKTLSKKDEYAISEPRLSPDRRSVIYLVADDDKVHFTYVRPRVVSVGSDTKSDDLRPSFSLQSSDKLLKDLACFGLPERVFLEGEKCHFAMIHNFVRSKRVLLKIPLVNDDKCPASIIEAPEGQSATLLDVFGDKMLVLLSSPSTTETVWECRLEKNGEFAWNKITNERFPHKSNLSAEPDKSAWCEHYELIETFIGEKAEDKRLAGESIILFPKKEKSKLKSPLLLFLHGGPHMSFPANFNRMGSYLCSLGFAICAPNYGGSLGFGRDFLTRNLGNTSDLDDVMAILEDVCDRFEDKIDRGRVGLIGGSYGGYLSCILPGKFPDRFKTAVGINPVTNLGALSALSDVPDWNFVEAGFEWKDGQTPDKEIYGKMLSKSPVTFCDNIKIPMLLMLGKEDARVPYLHNKNFWERLKAKGGESRIFLYEKGTHSLRADVEMETDVAMNSALWLMKHLCK